MSELQITHHLPDAVTIYEVPELAKLWLDSSQWTSDWCFDAQATQEIDSCGIQLLLVLNHHLQSLSHQLWIADASPEVTQALMVLGATELLVDTAGESHE